MIKKKKVGVIGASGRMGQELLQILKAHSFFTPFLGVSRRVQDSGYAHTQKAVNGTYSSQCDIVIDFSMPESLSEVIGAAKSFKIPLVCGTTGLSVVQHDLLQSLGQTVPVVWSPNMSLGVNVMLQMLELLRPLSNFDFQIEEIHHNRKKDKPSGTALYLQKKLSAVLQRTFLEPVSIRGGGIFGDHKVYAISDDELLCLEHRSLNRSIFASGALRAAEWLLAQPPGFYSMQDVLFSKAELHAEEGV